MAELVARMRAVLRRSGREGRSVFVLGDLRIDADGHSVVRADRAIELTHREFALLVEMCRHPGMVLSTSSVTRLATIC